MEVLIGYKDKKENKTANKRQYFREYYQKNKDKYKQYAQQQKMKFYCPVCDTSVYNMPVHFESKAHKARFQKSLPIEMKELNVEGINLENL